MPLSTSSSKDPVVSPEPDFFPKPGTLIQVRHVRTVTTVLLAGLSLILLAAELSARYLYPRMSRIEKRIVQDENEVRSIERNPSAVPTVLLLGNSLLLHGLDYPRIWTEIGPEVRVVRYTIENTEYLDWYYGLKSLFARGVKPDLVVLCLNIGQMLSHNVLDESSLRLFRARDLVAVSRAAQMSNTQASGLIFDHWSAFYASRSGVRNYILNVTQPGYSAALHALAEHPPVYPPKEEMIVESRARLRTLRELCRENGSHFVLLVAPSLGNRDEVLLTAGALEGIDVDAPVGIHELGPEYFLDGFHLNPTGAQRFTGALAHDLRARLPSH
jgi:hypothetical protein